MSYPKVMRRSEIEYYTVLDEESEAAARGMGYLPEGEPTAADLDKVDEEQRIQEATAPKKRTKKN